jgi:glyoxylase-like metal-dependent hydrolase (beta-lactamase superfamily II)
MHQLAEDVWQIPLLPRNGVNAYLLGDVLVDAGVKQHAKKLVKAVAGRTVSAHAITHAHGDHVGGSKGVVDALGVPFWCPAGDVAAVESGRQVIAESPIKALMKAGAKFDSVPIARVLQEGDDIGAGFVVLDTPGHSPGHVTFWRERDRVAVLADVFFNMNILTLQYGLREPVKAFTVDPALNRASERRIAALRPELVLFGHGPALRDPAAIEQFVAGLPAD